MVRQRSAKPLFAGSIPAVASIILLPDHFSFAATVESHGWYQLAPFRWSREERVLRRKESIGGRVVDLEVTVVDGELRVGASGKLPRASFDELQRRIGRMLQLDVDLAGFMTMAGRHESHAWVVRERFGRLLCGTTVWEDAVKIIATTNTTWRQTRRMIELLVEKCGQDGAFPDPENVLAFDPDELQRDCRLGYRAKSIHALASAIASKQIDLEAISDSDEPSEHLYKRYLTLPGIGPYGAAHLLAMQGRHDFIAVDSEFRRFVRETYHRGRRVSDATMLRRYEKWGRWKYLAYWSELWGSVADRLQPGTKGDQQSTPVGDKPEY